MTELKVKQTFSFDVYATNLLGSNFQNVRVMALLDYETANQNIDAEATHVAMMPYLPAGTPVRALDCTYVKLRMPSGETTVLALEWIKASSVVAVTNTVALVKISGIVASDLALIQTALLSNGFSNIEITLN